MALVNIQLTGHRELESKLAPGRVKRITWSAIYEAARAGKTLISRDVREQLAAPAAIVNKAISAERSGDLGTGGFSEVRVKRDPIALKYFSPRQTRAGVSIVVRRDQGRRVIAGAFGPKISKLGGRVYKRKGDEPKPLQELFGQTAASIAANSPNLIQRVSKRIADTLRARYISKLEYELSKNG